MSIRRDTSTSVSFNERLEASESHFKWISIRRFVCLAYVLSSSPHTFDLFSKAYDFNNVRIYDFVLIEIVIGVTYMVMDLFIRLYTRKVDFGENLNPLMRGITIGILINSGLLITIHAMNLLDSMHFLASSLQTIPMWAKCPKNTNITYCVPTSEIVVECNKRLQIPLTNTSAHLNYINYFASGFDYNNLVLSDKIFLIGFIWTIILILSTATEANLLKLFKFAFMWRLISTIVAFLILTFSETFNARKQLSEMLSLSPPLSYFPSITLVCKIFNIGSVGIYDFGTMSPLTMVDNAVLVFAIIYTILSFATSYIVKFLYANILRCIVDDYEESKSWHYFGFCILPLSTEFANTQKFYMIYIYINFVISMFAYLALVTMTMAKVLHSEFRFIKKIYIVGMLCVASYLLSIPLYIVVSMNAWLGLISGSHLMYVYLGGLKAIFVFWVYGVNKFSTDIHFWLGFKPTKFWTLCWAILPVLLFAFYFNEFSIIISTLDTNEIAYGSFVWQSFIAAVVGLAHIGTVIKFLMKNNIRGLFQCSKSYGPLEREDRKRRQSFNEAELHRKCVHRCIMLDDKLECNHIPLALPDAGDTSSLTSIYEAQPTSWHHSSQINIRMHSKND